MSSILHLSRARGHSVSDGAGSGVTSVIPAGTLRGCRQEMVPVLPRGCAPSLMSRNLPQQGIRTAMTTSPRTSSSPSRSAAVAAAPRPARPWGPPFALHRPHAHRRPSPGDGHALLPLEAAGGRLSPSAAAKGLRRLRRRGWRRASESMAGPCRASLHAGSPSPD